MWSVTTRGVAVLALATVALAGCGIQKQNAATSGPPAKTEAVVHTGPGGGSDIFARQVVKMMQESKLITGNWPVRNQTEGSSIGAMSYVNGKRGRDDTVAAITPTWLVTPLTLKSSSVTLDNLQPIAQLVVEPQVMAVRADSPYRTAQDFAAAAKEQPGRLVQVGGSVTATDSLTGKALQAQSGGGTWKFLSFSDGGQRIATLLRGDAQMMIGSSGDFAEQVKAGELRVIAVVGAERVETFPEVTSLKEQGFTVDNLPQEFRGFVGPPEMPQSAVTYYQDLFAKLVKTPQWAAYAKENGIITQFRGAAEFKQMLGTQKASLTQLVEQLDLGAK
ncbi:MAG: Bug family tripartite tricarboxylate transporter substrate binding protein [Actinomadura sp.]